MLWFDQKRIPEGLWPFLGTVRAGLREMQEGLVDRLDLSEGTGNLLVTGCIQAYRQAVVRRALDLAQATVASWNAGMPIGAIVCSRALLETIATFHSFLTRAEAAARLGDWTTISDLVDAYAFSTITGPKTAEHPPRMSRMVTNFIKETQPGHERFWAQICEATHPNGDGMMRFAGDLREQRYDARTTKDSEPQLFHAVFNCLHSCCWMIAADTEFEILLEQIRTGGLLPSDHELITKRNSIEGVVARVMKHGTEMPPAKPKPIS